MTTPKRELASEEIRRRLEEAARLRKKQDERIRVMQKGVESQDYDKLYEEHLEDTALGKGEIG